MVRNDLGVALAEECAGCSKALLKHLAAAGIRSWEGLDAPALHRFRLEVERTTSLLSSRSL